MYLYKAVIFDWENCLAQTRKHPVTLSNGAERLLNRLYEDGIQLAILTNGQPGILDRYVKFDQIRPLFEAIVTARDVEAYKPQPDGIEAILRQLSCLAEEVLMIGDSETDIAAGEAALVDTLLYLGEGETVTYSDEDISRINPTYAVRSFAEVLELIAFGNNH